MLSTIPNLSSSTLERGFHIYRKWEIPSTGGDTTFTGYKRSPVFTGTDSSIFFTNGIPYQTVFVSFFHTHGPTKNAAQSAADIYLLINDMMTEPYTVGNFAASSNGDVYGITVTNPSLALAFYGTQNQNVISDKWNPESDIGKAFDDARNYFRKLYTNSTNKENLAYEKAMAVVLKEYNTGVTLNKKDATGHFIPIVMKKTPDPRKPKRSIYTQDCL